MLHYRCIIDQCIGFFKVPVYWCYLKECSGLNINYTLNSICDMLSITAGNNLNTLVCKSKEIFTDNALIVHLMVLHQDKC